MIRAILYIVNRKYIANVVTCLYHRKVDNCAAKYCVQYRSIGKYDA